MSAEITVTFDLVDDGREDERRKLVDALQELQVKQQSAKEAGDEKLMAMLDREIEEKQSLLVSMAPEMAEEEQDVAAVVPQPTVIQDLKVAAQRAGITLASFFGRN